MASVRLLHEQGMLAESEELLLEVLEGRMTLLGESDPATLTTLNNLGGLPLALNRIFIFEHRQKII